MAEERISRISASEISLRHRPAVFTVSASPSHRASQPRYRRMRTDASTSRSRGQRRSTVSPRLRSVAARIGSALFFAPCTAMEPESAFAPLTMICVICPSLRIKKWFNDPSYAKGRGAGYTSASTVS